jgi:hypothetical protein
MHKFMRIAVGIVALFAGQAHANLVQNGGFETTTLTGSGDPNGTTANWSFPGFPAAHIFFPGTADALSDISAMWGPANGSSNGLPTTSPSGGNFLVQDANFLQTPISQTINGLTPFTPYTLTFEWGVGQWYYALPAPVYAGWDVTLGATTLSTGTITIPWQGFSGWFTQTMTFVPTSATEVLSFLSIGGGDPPYALLDGVTLSAVPEPAAWVLMLVGFGGVGFVSRARVRRVTA